MDDNLRFKELKQAVLNGSWPELQDPQDKKILQAAENGNWDEITNLLTEGINLNKIFARRHFGDETVLVAASMYDQVECVQKLVELGAGLNEDDLYMTIYQSALEYAAIRGHLECFRFLTEARLFRRVSNTDLYDDIIAASKRGDFEHALIVLYGNIDKDLLHGWIGNNLMSLFIIHGCPRSCIQGLIDRGVDINGYDFNGFTPLMAAVLSENIDCVHYLLHSKADINIFSVNITSYFYKDGTTDPNVKEKDKCQGKSALMYAASFKNVQCLKAMLGVISENDINTTNALMYSPLRWAAYFGNLESISLLLKSGALIFYDPYQLGDAYALAILSGNIDCLDILLRNKPGGMGINLFEPNTSKKFLGNSHCLHVLLQYYDDIDVLNELLRTAVHHCFSDSVCLLLEKGANADCRDSAGATLLMLSSSQGSLEIMKLLIKHGADIDVQDENENTAIIYAACENNVECVQLLLELGANVHIKNKDRQSVFLICCMNGHAEIAAILTLHVGANAQEEEFKSAIILATIKNDMKCLEMLFDLGANIHSRNNFVKTALIIASERGYLKVMDLLLRKGAEVNAQDDEGWTAAMRAARGNHSECLQLLMGANADVEVLNQNGDSVFSASMCGDGSCLEILLRSEKLFDDGKLKSLHQSGLLKSGAESEEDSLTLKHIILILQFKVFDWKTSPYYSYGFDRFIFAALQCGYGVVEISDTSPATLAYCRNNIPTLSYLLANLCFFPGDYNSIMHLYSTRNTRRRGGRLRFMRSKRSHRPAVRIIDQLAYRPLSLQAWTFLNISKAISQGGPPTERSWRVDSLPLPDRMKNKLKFQTRLSRTCYHQWEDIGYNFGFGDFLSNTFVFPEETDNPCTNWCSGYCVRYKSDHERGDPIGLEVPDLNPGRERCSSS